MTLASRILQPSEQSGRIRMHTRSCVASASPPRSQLANAEAPLAHKWQLLNLFAYGNLLDYRSEFAQERL